MTEQADKIRSRRQAFAAPGSVLDKIVRYLAIGLPALVGVIAALMLITPLSPRSDISFLLDRNKVAIAEDRLRVDNAMYRGQDSRGRPFSVSAGRAVQSSDNVPVVEMSDLTARIVLPDGPAVLSAPGGSYDIEKEQVTIPGIVQFTAADGYAMSARNVLVDFPSRIVSGEGRVEGVIPAGTFEADVVRANLAERTFSLEGHARLRMIPGELRVPEEME